MTTRAPDAAMLRAWWAAGAWDRLTPVLQHVILGTIHTFALDADDKDDLVQDVIVRSWEYPEIPVNPKSFVASVARHLALDRTRRLSVRRRVRGVTGERALAEMPSRDLDPLTFIERSESHARLRRAITTLPRRTQMILVRHYGRQESTPRIARSLHLGHSAVKMIVHRAKHTLAPHVA